MKNIQKFITLIITISLLNCNSTTHKRVEIGKKEITEFENIFKDLKDYLIKENGNLWNHQLYGPLLFVNQDNRTVIANEKDTKGFLTKNGEIFAGILPDEINIANTAFDWNGKRWTMVILPLPNDYNERLNLLTHELFHRIQPEIGFSNLVEKQSNHLDDLDGRIFLKLELEALKKALISDVETNKQKYIQDALLFRNYRHIHYSGAKENENTLELNEGLAEYTGSILSNRSDEKLKEHYVQMINNFYNNQTFVRSFAYITIPVYGYFIKLKNDSWNKDISNSTNLTDYISDFFKISIPTNLIETINAIKGDYGFEEIASSEIKRENEQKKLLAEYEVKFLKNPTLTIQFENMSISFNPSNIIPLKDLGTVYPNLRVSDNWGILTIENGALLSNNWDKVTVSEPLKTSDKTIEGDGWKLELNKNWKLVKINENYTLKTNNAP
jgi:hypothetical protein